MPFATGVKMKEIATLHVSLRVMPVCRELRPDSNADAWGTQRISYNLRRPFATT